MIEMENSKANRNDTAICTIISKNYLAFARVLTESYLQYNDSKVFVLLIDKIDNYFNPDKEKFTLIKIDTIKDKISDFDRFSFQYNIRELATSFKPFFLEYLFERYQFKKIIFFCPDILITYNLTDLFKLLDKFAIVITPHITQPFKDTHMPSEIDILKTGVYNLGFLALSSKRSTRDLLNFWKERLMRYCTVDFENGLYVDQKWIDLIPGFFDDVFILRDTSYNVAYWNLHYRRVSMNGENISVDGKPAHFLHFSRLDFTDPNFISDNQNRFRLNELHEVKPIFELYKNKIMSSGYDISKNWPCIFNYFDNGIRIPDIVRMIYRELNDNSKSKFGNPFNTLDKNSYFNWLNQNIDEKNPKITRFMYEVYKKRTDLQLHYPHLVSLDRERFFSWFLINAKREYNLEGPFLEKIFPFNIKKERRVFISIKTKAFYKISSILKYALKKFSKIFYG